MKSLEEMAEELKAKLAQEDAIRANRIKILKSLDTKAILEQIPQLEDNLERALREDSSFRNLNAGYLASQGSDCSEVKKLMAALSPQGKNAGEREAWLTQQRTLDIDIIGAIQHQLTVAYELENHRIAIEMARRRLESMRTVLALKTAQIEFLTMR